MTQDREMKKQGRSKSPMRQDENKRSRRGPSKSSK